MRLAHLAIVVIAVGVALVALSALAVAVFDRPVGHQALLWFGGSLIAADLPACLYVLWRAARHDDDQPRDQ